MVDQDKQISQVTKTANMCTSKIKVSNESIAALTESVIILHMVQQNINNDMSKINLISTKPVHDLILKDRKPTLSPDKKGAQVNIEMEKPILDLSTAINRTSNDPRAQARFLDQVKHACLDFRSTPIKF